MSKAEQHNLFKIGKGQSPLLSALILIVTSLSNIEDASDTQAKKNFFPLRILKRGARPKRLRSDGVGENKKTVIPTNQF